jgi:glycosyltransferase involved in cell wall biosynthesis
VPDRSLHIGVDGRELIGQPTGVGRYIEHVLREWSTDPTFPHRLTVFLSSPPPAQVVERLPRIEFVVDGASAGGTLWEQTRLPAAIRRAGPDVFFAAGYTAPLRMPCPFVVAIYDVSFCAHPEWFSWREGLRRRWLTASAGRRASSVITISEFSAREITRWLGVRRDRIHLAPPGPPARPTSLSGAADPQILYAGSIFSRRHVPELIEAFALLVRQQPFARLTLVGANRSNPPVDPRAIASTLGIAASVVWREYVDDAELEGLYGSARVFAFLSDYEGFAMTPMEALAHGVPSVLLDTPVAREVYGDGALLVQLDPASIARALHELLVEGNVRERTLSAGQRRLAALSWSRTADTIRERLEDAAR